jgi:putative endonuclease
MGKQYFVYILASGKYSTLYTGVTADLVRRVYEHQQELLEGFTKQYNIHRLVYYEIHNDIQEAIKREKQIKRWNRDWKISLIEENNLDWMDLYPVISVG